MLRFLHHHLNPHHPLNLPQLHHPRAALGLLSHLLTTAASVPLMALLLCMIMAAGSGSLWGLVGEVRQAAFL